MDSSWGIGKQPGLSKKLRTKNFLQDMAGWRTLWECIGYNSTEAHEHSVTVLLLTKQASLSAFSYDQHTNINPHITHAQGYFFTGCGGFKAYAHILWYFFSQEVVFSPWLCVGFNDLLRDAARRWGWVVSSDEASAWLWLSTETCPLATK